MEHEKEKSPRGRLAAGQPNPVDVHVGNRIKWRRKVLKLSQQQMADRLGLTFQQVQKYEKGLNRVGASRLWDISRVLGVSMDFFFAEMDASVKTQSPMMLGKENDNNVQYFEEDGQNMDFDPMKRKETLELVSAYYKINNRKVAKQLFDLIVAVSKSDVHLNNNESKE
ncbi:MAG: helix-turn-helix transcriptional regulator [Alphaproteobacteria bacterium]|nr:helix-turn-helix transcriptional regulator [Alphaproteobacteria bacterium]MBO7097336.1 helix-turn-helix transcriptional regulator [Alphaproteobacteria bacterium]